jgi:DNA-binding transcriptional regulator YhcF (GntR family)
MPTIRKKDQISKTTLAIQEWQADGNKLSVRELSEKHKVSCAAIYRRLRQLDAANEGLCPHCLKPLDD